MRKWNRPEEKASVRRGFDKQTISGVASLVGMAVLLCVSMLPGVRGTAPDTDAAQAGSDAASTLAADCQLVQHLTYTACGHSLTRRQNLPAELAGKNRGDLEAAYDRWQITAYAAHQVEMAQALDMFCPQHVILMPDDSGMLCVFENRYGDALALVRELHLPLSDLPDAYQELLRPGKGFDTLDELELWLESIDS